MRKRRSKIGQRHRGGVAAAMFGAALAVCGCTGPAPPQPAATGQSLLRPTLNAKWLNWPPKDGCADAEVAESLPPGSRIDRYGSERGSFFAVPGTSYDARSLPYQEGTLTYTVYVVLKPLPVLECATAPWFDEPGGGKQFKATESAAQLRAEGVIAPR